MIHPNAINSRTRTGGPAKAFALAFAAALALAAAPAGASAQAREMLNRLVQSQGQNDPAARALTQGRGYIDDGKWEQAVSTLDRFVREHGSDRNVDAALYWLAYARSKKGELTAAVSTLDQLLQSYPRSNWADDAKVLSLEVRARINPNSVGDVDEKEGDDLKIIALKALCENDKATCSARCNEVLRSNNSARVKEAAIIFIGRYGGTEAVPGLLQMARTEPNEKLRMRAIRALGNTNDDRALDVLREIAMGATYADESPTDSAIHALSEHDSPRAVTILSEVATRGQNLRARTHAIELMSRQRGEAVVGELLRLYDAVPEVEVKQYVLAALGTRRDPRALAKLVEVARSAGDVKLRAQAIRAIPNRGEAEDLDLLLSLYDSERDDKLKDSLLSAVGRYQTERAYQKLKQVVRNPAEPIERRKTAISILSRSKDPGVLQFLAEMLK
ncbi:MAG TPA: HEAT repeat domain-containing protein [Pyrinomonadaceae bacterium]|jgi:HEAT repeat protein|nr:HEAT repeat domain-containing protein [Pyrinomonadaceae bacterium]